MSGKQGARFPWLATAIFDRQQSPTVTRCRAGWALSSGGVEVGAGGWLLSDGPATGSLEAAAPWPLGAVGSGTRSTVETCLKPHIEGGAEVTKYWMDKRHVGDTVLGRIFTGKASTVRRS